MGVITITENSINYERRGETARIMAWGKDVLRFQSSPNGAVIEEDWVLLSRQKTNVKTYMEGDHAVIISGSIKAELYENGKVIYYQEDKNFEDDYHVILEEMTEYAFDMFYRTYRAKGSNTHMANVLFKPDKNEHFYGLGGEHNDCFDMKGSTSELQHRNTKTSIPFVYSSKGYGFLWNNPSVGQVELTNNHTKWTAYCTKQVDYLVISGYTPAEIMGKYADITGHTPDFPKFASGFWQCKLRYESQEDLLAVAKEYKKRNIPISVIVIDYFHWTNQGDFKFDPKYWPNPKAMVKELEAMGIKLMVSVWPTSNPQSENYRYMDDRNMIMRTENGVYGMQDFYGQQDYIDTFNYKTAEYVWNLIKKNYYDNGVKLFWLDEAEPGMIPNHYDNVRCIRGNFEEFALLYPYYYSKMFYDGLKSEGETEIISLARAGYIGCQRHATLLWSGDVPSTFDALRKSVKTGLSMAMSGMSWWTTDIGGFWGGDIESDYFRELIVRWFQFGVFCPVTRLHGVRIKPKNHKARHPEVKECSGGDNEIWSFGKRNYVILRALIELRERLRPYIMECMEETRKNGTPVMRPMFYEYPKDKICYSIDDQYFFGPDIIFAPITDKGVTKRKVYLPAGKWKRVGQYNKNMESLEGMSEVTEGGKWIEADADIYSFIAYVREEADMIYDAFKNN